MSMTPQEVSAEECERFVGRLHERHDPSKEDEEIADIARTVLTLHARLAERDAEIARLNDRLRETCRILVDAVGADGPCDAEDAARKAAAEIAALKAEVARLRARTALDMDLVESSRAKYRMPRIVSGKICESDPIVFDPASHDLTDADLDLLP